ncbi:hypothetical protein SAMN02910292_02893 [Lachnospiraceae bacterium XBB2008]|nr:hypothetical protein SAMN02910292_02893 [Lachnospiraceae bacterium XBB2008]
MSFISNLLDDILDDYSSVTGFKVSSVYWMDEHRSSDCTILLEHELDTEGQSTIDLDLDEDGNLINGIRFEYTGDDYSTIESRCYSYKLTKKQSDSIVTILSNSREYKNYLAARQQYAEAHVFKRINELLQAGVIEWDGPEEDVLESFETGWNQEITVSKYTAEYGDVVFTYTETDDDEAIQYFYEQIDEEDDPPSLYDYLDLTPTLIIEAGNYFKCTIYDISEEDVDLLFESNDPVEDDWEVNIDLETNY